MCFDDRADDGKTHSETFLFRGEELLEEPLLRWLWDPGTIVAHSDGDRAVDIVIRGNLHLPAARRSVTHRIEGVANEINQHLLNLAGIAFDGRQILREGHFHFAKVCGGVQVNHVRDGFSRSPQAVGLIRAREKQSSRQAS